MWALRVSHSAVVTAWRARERVLRRRGHRVTVVSANRWHEGGRLVSLVPLPEEREGEHLVPARTLGSHPALFVYDPRPLWRALGQPIDVIDIHEEPFALATAEVLLLRALRRQRAPYVLYTAQNIDKRYPPPFRWLEHWALRGASGIYACNSVAARIAERKGFPGRARTIDLGTDLALFSPGPLRPPDQAVGARSLVDAGQVGGPAPAKMSVIGYVGRLVSAKGVEVLLDALSRDARLCARIAGDGPQRAALEQRSAQLGITQRVEFVGALGNHELPDFYRSIDVLSVPSLTTSTWVEQFGRVVLEAMACGTPVVVSDSGALPEVVGDAAMVVPEGRADLLSEALGAIGRDPDLALRLREAGLRRAQQSDWEKVAAAHEELLFAAQRRVAAEQGERPLDVVIVAYGAPDLLARALAGLQGLDEARVMVVDNSSSEAVRGVVERADVEYVDPGRNGGFAAGVNVGLRMARPGSDVLLVNPDAVIGPPDIKALRAGLAADGGLASVGPVQVDADGQPSRVEWPYPSPLGTWIEAAGLGRLRRNAYVIGSVLLLRREALDQVGPFDDARFFLYAEETDWAKRASRLGWRHGLVTAARAVHVGAATSKDPEQREHHFHAAQEIYLRKHHGTLGWHVARAGQLVGSTLRAALHRGAARETARRRLRLYARGPAAAEVRPADSMRSGARPVCEGSRWQA